MQIKVTTDYAIRIVLYTTIIGDVVSSKTLSDNMKIPQSIVRKLGKKLSEHGILEITTGASGGFRMIRPPRNVSLYDILSIFEPTTNINRCLDEDRYCSRFATETCPVRRAYESIQHQFEQGIKSVTIESLIRG